MTESAKTPWHLWLVGILALILNGGSAFDYVMTQTRNAAYMSEFTPEQLEYFYGFPAWVDGVWAASVWSGVLGAILLLVRRAWAVPVLWFSFITTIAIAAFMFLLYEKSAIDAIGTAGAVFSLVIIVVAWLFAWYAHRMRTSGVLR